MIGERLRAIRRTTGLTMKAFAEATGVKYTTYAGYESGAHEPGADILTKVAQHWDTTVDYLLGATDTMHPQPPAQVIPLTDDPARTILTPAEYAFLTAWRAADPRAREDALGLLTSHRREPSTSQAQPR